MQYNELMSILGKNKLTNNHNDWKWFKSLVIYRLIKALPRNKNVY